MKNIAFALNVLNSDYDVICLTETWLDENVASQELFPGSDFIVYREDRNFARMAVTRGGGVLIAVRSNLHSSRVMKFAMDGECVWVEIKFYDYSLYICTVYFVHSSHDQYNEFFEKSEVFCNLFSHNACFVILGD